MDRPESGAEVPATQRANAARTDSVRATDRSAEATRRAKRLVERAQQLTTVLAGTESRLASTLRDTAARAAQHGRHADAQRLLREAEDAERYAGVERRRAEQA